VSRVPAASAPAPSSRGGCGVGYGATAAAQRKQASSRATRESGAGASRKLNLESLEPASLARETAERWPHEASGSLNRSRSGPLALAVRIGPKVTCVDGYVSSILGKLRAQDGKDTGECGVQERELCSERNREAVASPAATFPRGQTAGPLRQPKFPSGRPALPGYLLLAARQAVPSEEYPTRLHPLTSVSRAPTRSSATHISLPPHLIRGLTADLTRASNRGSLKERLRTRIKRPSGNGDRLRIEAGKRLAANRKLSRSRS
jgi:hypothetical protein